METMKFRVYYALGSSSLSAKAKNVISEAYEEIASSLSANAKVTVKVTGWVQPTNSSPNIRQLSRGRAQAVVDYLKSLGLEAEYKITAPGEAKSNSAKSRRASVVVTWSNS